MKAKSCLILVISTIAAVESLVGKALLLQGSKLIPPLRFSIRLALKAVLSFAYFLLVALVLERQGKLLSTFDAGSLFSRLPHTSPLVAVVTQSYHNLTYQRKRP